MMNIRAKISKDINFMAFKYEGNFLNKVRENSARQIFLGF